MALHRHSLEQKLRQTETALRQSEQFQKYIINNMYDPVSLTDLNGNFKYLGPSHAILGYDLDSLIGKNVMDYVHPNDFERVLDVFNKFLLNINNIVVLECIVKDCSTVKSYAAWNMIGRPAKLFICDL